MLDFLGLSLQNTDFMWPGNTSALVVFDSLTKTDSVSSFRSSTHAHLARLSNQPDKWNMTAGLSLLLYYSRSEQFHVDVCAHIAHIQMAEGNLIVSRYQMLMS